MRAILTVSLAVTWLCLCCKSAQAQFIYFDNKYDSGITGFQSEGLGPSLLETDDGYVFAAISINNQTFRGSMYFVRTDWFGEPQLEVTHVVDTVSEFFNAMIAAHDGNYVTASTADLLYLPDFDSQVGLSKLSPSGEFIWKRQFGADSLIEIGLQVIGTADLGYALIGQRSVIPNQDADMYLVRTDSMGNMLWERQYGGNHFEAGRSLVNTSDGGFLLLGWTRSFGAGQRDFYLVKTDSLGNQQWQRTYGGSGDESGLSIMLLSDGNYLLTGAGSQGSDGSIGRKYKVNSEGGVVWSKTYAYPDNSGNNLWRTVELPSGDLVSAGMTNNLSNAGWLVRTDNQGNVLWQREYDYNSNTDLFYTLIATSDGGFLLGGQAKHDFPLTQDAWLLKVDSVGCTYADCLVGIDDHSSGKVVADVWPNPASSILNVEWQRQGTAEIGLLDMTGKQVLRQSGNGQLEVVDVSHLPSGIYVLQMAQGEVRTTLRIVVQH
ncbi:MAG: T9SS type A sorting domain-containing protein [Flavobacteriales bacterium]|nr:T9SS type A sorting domain-containing protein [Flavobacteriales bacterium]